MAAFHPKGLLDFKSESYLQRLNIHPDFQCLVSSMMSDCTFSLPVLNSRILSRALCWHFPLYSPLISGSPKGQPLSFSMVSPKFSLFLSEWLTISTTYPNDPSSICDYTFSNTGLETCFPWSTMEFKRQEDIKDNSHFTRKKNLTNFFPPNHTFTT